MKKIETKDTSPYTQKILSPPNESDKIFRITIISYTQAYKNSNRIIQV